MYEANLKTLIALRNRLVELAPEDRPSEFSIDLMAEALGCSRIEVSSIVFAGDIVREICHLQVGRAGSSDNSITHSVKVVAEVAIHSPNAPRERQLH